MDSNRFFVYRHEFPNGVKYVGKGCRYRDVRPDRRGPYWNALYKKYGFPISVRVYSNLDEELALFCEEELIDLYTRDSVKLCNLTKGGEGISGYKYTPEQLARTSVCRKEYMNRPEIRAKYAESTKRHMNKPEVKAAMAAKLAKRMEDPEFRARKSAMAKQISARPEIKALRAAQMSSYLEKNGHPLIKKDVYTFVHADGREFTGTMYALRKYDPKVRASALTSLIQGKLRTTANWRLKK